MFKLVQKIASAATFIVLFTASSVSAATILSIEDAGRGSGSTAVGPGQSYAGVAQSFTAQKDFTDVAVSFNLTCFSCVGELLFMRGVPADDAFFRAIQSVSVIDNTTTGDDIFKGLALEAGAIYSMILTITSGDAIWRASDAPILGGTGGVTAADRYLRLTEINNNFIPWSPTEERPGAILQFSLNQTVTPVPLPAGILSLGFALFALGFLRRRKA